VAYEATIDSIPAVGDMVGTSVSEIDMTTRSSCCRVVKLIIG
jgi:hypothetical protein